MTTAIQALTQQRLLLQMEYAAEKEAYRKQTEEIGLQRKVKRGDSWYPIKLGKSYYNSLNQLVVEVFRQGDEEIEHNFEFGRPVAFFSCQTNPASSASKASPAKIKYFPFTATVSYVDGDRMVVAVPDNGQLIDIQGAENVGIQLFFDETSYKMMFEALDRIIRAKGRLGHLRDLFYYTGQKAETFTFAPMHFPYLNRTQEDAVNKVLWAKDVAIVHGPPGNMAVDWISEKLVDRGINVLRIGNPTRVNDKMLSFTYERRFEAHPDYTLLWSIRKAIRDLRSHRKRGDERFHQKLERLKERATELEVRINAQLFGEARVIACTLVGSANRLLEGQKFGTLFIDEAAQALEAACWIPIRRVSRVILAGDHCQLPPTIKSYAALKAGLGKTLMERIVENHPETVTLLKMQYRMNEEIMRFSSDWFYGNQVESAPEVKYRSILDLDIPMTWIDTSQFTEYADHSDSSDNSEPTENPSKPLFREEFVGESFGRINKAEAELTLLALEQYFKKIGKERILEERLDVGVISPYRAQVQYLRRLFKKREFFKPYRHLISVNTVDGFQGQERDIILISLVRANDEGQIGFLRDLRRMNVAITRARMKLMILGDASTMTRHPFYKKLYEYIDAL